MTQYIIALDAANVAHTNTNYLAHAISVYQDLKAWNCNEALCRAGLFQSIYAIGWSKPRAYTSGITAGWLTGKWPSAWVAWR